MDPVASTVRKSPNMALQMAQSAKFSLSLKWVRIPRKKRKQNLLTFHVGRRLPGGASSPRSFGASSQRLILRTAVFQTRFNINICAKADLDVNSNYVEVSSFHHKLILPFSQAC